MPSLRTCLVVVLSMLAASTACAQTDDERARMHFDAGRSYYEDGAYEQSLQEFERAYALSQRPAMLSNMANCEERLGRWTEAAEHLEQFLPTVPEGERATLERRIANLRQRAQRQEPPPAATPSAGAPGRPASDGLLVPGLILIGTGAAGLVAWGVLGGLALAEESRIADACGATVSCTPAEVQAMDDLALGSDIAMGIGLALAATGAILLIADPPRGASGEAAVAPFIAPGAAGLVVAGRIP